MDIVKYTDVEIAKNLALLENHLKQSPFTDEFFCKDCISKHRVLLIGLAEEGMTAGGDSKKYEKVYEFMDNLKDQDYKEEGVKLSQKVRQMRKDLFDECSDCSNSIKNIAKHLNNNPSYNNYIHNSDSHINDYNQLNTNKKNMVTYTELGFMNAGQFAAEGVKYLAETNATLIPYEKYVTIGGGIGLQALGLFVKMPKALKTISIVAGSNLLAAGVIKMVRSPPVGVAGARFAAGNVVVGNSNAGKFTGQPNGRVFGGRVTATNIPTQYARAGILAGAQAFESPEHADLIRVD